MILKNFKCNCVDYLFLYLKLVVACPKSLNCKWHKIKYITVDTRSFACYKDDIK